MRPLTAGGAEPREAEGAQESSPSQGEVPSNARRRGPNMRPLTAGGAEQREAEGAQHASPLAGEAPPTA